MSLGEGSTSLEVRSSSWCSWPKITKSLVPLDYLSWSTEMYLLISSHEGEALPQTKKAQFWQQIASLSENNRVLEAQQGQGPATTRGQQRTRGQPWQWQRIDLQCTDPKYVTCVWFPLPSMLCFHVWSGWKRDQQWQLDADLPNRILTKYYSGRFAIPVTLFFPIMCPSVFSKIIRMWSTFISRGFSRCVKWGDVVAASFKFWMKKSTEKNCLQAGLFSNER